MSTEKVLFSIFVSAIITFFLRGLPFFLFKKNQKLPENITYLGKILPSAIMAVLIVYCLKDVGDNFFADGIWKIIAVLVVAVTYKWKHSTFLSIVAGTVCYMLFLNY